MGAGESLATNLYFILVKNFKAALNHHHNSYSEDFINHYIFHQSTHAQAVILLTDSKMCIYLWRVLVTDGDIFDKI